MLITNHTHFCLGVNSKEFLGYIQPQSSKEVPDDAALHWLKKSTPAALRERGLITLRDTHGEGTTAVETKPARRPHWRKSVALINETEDLDALMELHTNETRPKVLAVIEARMETLNGEVFPES